MVGMAVGGWELEEGAAGVGVVVNPHDSCGDSGFLQPAVVEMVGSVKARWGGGQRICARPSSLGPCHGGGGGGRRWH